jgi:hypothetical protein
MVFSRTGHAVVRLVYAILHRYNGVFEYSVDPECIFCIAESTSHHDVRFSDGTHLERGDRVLVLHLWNERVRELGERDTVMAAGVVFARRLRRSLELLADYLRDEPRFRDVRCLYAEFGFLQDDRGNQAERVLRRLGFDVIPGVRPGWNAARAAYWSNVFSWWMMLVFAPFPHARKSFARIRRYELWMSRDRLAGRYAPRADQPSLAR